MTDLRSKLMNGELTETERRPLGTPGAFSRHVAVTFIIQSFVLVLAIAYTAVLGRWLGAEGKGTLELALLLPSLMGLFLSGGVGVANAYYGGSGGIDVATLVANSLSFTILLSLIGFATVFLLMTTGWMTRLLPDIPSWLLILAMMGLPLELLGGYLRGILQGRQHILAANVVSLVRTASLLILTLLLSAGLNAGLAGALYAYLAASAIQLLSLTWILRKHGAAIRPRWHRITMRRMLGYGMRGHIGTVLQFYNYRLDVFLVNFLMGPGSVGLYNVSVRMAETLWFLPNAVGFVIFPKAAATSPERMNIFTPKVFRLTLLVTMLGAIALFAIAEPLILTIYGPAFSASLRPLLALLPGVVLLGGAKILTNEIAGRGFPQYNSIGAAAALIVTIALDILLIPRHGLVGASVASSIAYTLVFLSSIAFYLHVSRNSAKRSVDMGEDTALNQLH